MADYDFKPSQIKKHLIDLLQVGLVPSITSPPGVGKSAIVAEVAEHFNLELIDFRLSQATPEDLQGLPMRTEDGQYAQFVPFDTFPDESTPLPKGKDGFMIFFDEFNSANRDVLAASYKILYDKMVGMKKLHPNTVIVLAGNRDEDNAIVNDIGTALQSRIVHLTMRTDLRDFLAHAYKANFDHRIPGFLEDNPDCLHDFSPDHTNQTFACPRTYSFLSAYIKDKDIEQISLGVMAGTIGPAAAIKFYAFLKHYDEIPSYQAIVSDPKNTPLPPNSGAQFAAMSMLVSKMEKDDFDDICTYVDRIPDEMQIIFYRNVKGKDRKMSKHPAFIKRQMKFAEAFWDDDEEEFDHAA